MLAIPLSNGQKALVDDEDHEAAMRLSRVWHMTDKGYAKADWTEDMGYYRRKRVTYLHRFIMARKLGQPLPRNREVDHENRLRLDCQRGNLRLATYAQNCVNRTPQPGATGFIGVSTLSTGNFRAYLSRGNRQVGIGVFPTAEMAAYARDLAVREERGEFAVLNGVAPCALAPITNRAPGRSGLKGVKPHGDRWIARAKRKGVEHHIGVFDTPEEAAKARDRFLAMVIDR